MPNDAVAPLKQFIREVVDVGFGAGYLKEGIVQYPSGQKMGNADQVAAICWDMIVPVSLARKATGGGHKMSLWVDVEKGRPMEVEVST
jgi:2-dehydropantoate 2-reductase